MIIDRLRIINYKSFRDVTISMNSDVNIFVGENDSGKSTILEALAIVLTGKCSSGSFFGRINLDWFNIDTRQEFKKEIQDGKQPELPSIEIEAYFADPGENEVELKRFKGTNNSLREDAVGVKIEIVFDEQYSPAYKQLLGDNKINDIPIEYYRAIFRSFAYPEHYLQLTAKKTACIDTTRNGYRYVLNRFVSGSINEFLTEEEITNLRHAYRANRHEFTENPAVKTLNEKLQSSHSFRGKAISLNLRENEVDEWKNDMSISLDDIPLENTGFGTQNMFKSEIFLLQKNDVGVLIIEEPENSLSYTNMSMLVSKLSERNDRQLFISTHSSFVANKLGLQSIHLVANRKVIPFAKLSAETYNYFIKLPGYNTLRVLLANQAILVEGPADELIVQRAYIDNFGKQPIEDGIDVISVDSLAFLRYCELASLIEKHITIVTDNDHDPIAAKKRFEKYAGFITLCIEKNAELNTLEPSVLAANASDFQSFRRVIYRGNDIESRDEASIVDFMIKYKTEWSLRVFNSEHRICYPEYIMQAIGKAFNTNDTDSEEECNEQ